MPDEPVPDSFPATAACDPEIQVCPGCPHWLAQHYPNGCGWCICKVVGTATDDADQATTTAAPEARCREDYATHPFDTFRRAVVEALGLPYGTPEMFGGSRYPTDAEIVSWVGTERERVRKMHDGHHVGIEGFCPDCGMYGKGARST